MVRLKMSILRSRTYRNQMSVQSTRNELVVLKKLYQKHLMTVGVEGENVLHQGPVALFLPHTLPNLVLLRKIAAAAVAADVLDYCFLY